MKCVLVGGVKKGRRPVKVPLNRKKAEFAFNLNYNFKKLEVKNDEVMNVNGGESVVL